MCTQIFRPYRIYLFPSLNSSDSLKTELFHPSDQSDKMFHSWLAEGKVNMKKGLEKESTKEQILVSEEH